MSTEHTDPASNNTPTGGENKVTYTEEQQAHLQGLIDKAVGRAAREAREEAATAKAEASRLAAELAAAKEESKRSSTSSKSGDKVADLEAQLEEVKRASKATEQTVESTRQQLAEKEREVLRAREEAQNIRTEVAMTNAASKLPFVDLGVVLKLTRDQIKVDTDTGRLVVIGDTGKPKLNASFEPMSLDEFYNDFAAKNKYLVRGNVLPGAGGSDSKAANLTSNGRYEVSEIFGAKSSSVKAQQLYKENPTEYKRLREVAKASGLIA